MSGEFKSDKIEPLWKRGKIKEFLYKAQYRKCCYCERKRDIIEFNVDHFRPKAQVKEAETNHPGYWWLAYDWENLIIACFRCNLKKSSHFPLKDESKRASREKCDLEEEEPFLINPLKENPELFIDYDVSEIRLMVKAIGRCERGEKTVNELTGINTSEVMVERAEKLKTYRLIRDSMQNGDNKLSPEVNELLQDCVSPDSNFLGFARFYFQKEGCL